MNIQPDLRMDKSEFLTWVQARAGRYELGVLRGGGRWFSRRPQLPSLA